MSYHGYAPGYAQLIDSPTAFQITPMQIDTWNRPADIIFLKHGRSILRQSSNPVCGFSMMEQVRLWAV